MVATQVAINDRPERAALSPRPKPRRRKCPRSAIPLEIGKGRIVREGKKVRAAVVRHPSGRMREGKPTNLPPTGLSATIADSTVS